ncbi:MAG: PHP-associated domain-containing protein [Methanomassiliicoccales archaeon]|jgi:predicted metal-dependent phosphoesterase TrpH
MQTRADIHVHTRYSGWGRLGFLRFPESVANPCDVVKNAQAIGLKVVCITDHNSIEGAFKAKECARDYPGVDVVVGEEITTLDGELIGLYLTQEIPPGLPVQETIDRIRAQGGLVVAPHPFSLHCPSLGEKIDELDIDAIETLNAGHIDGYANRKAQSHENQGRWAIVGGSDSHSLNTIAYAYTLFDGENAEDLRKAILGKRTAAYGNRMPLEKGIAWSVGVVLASDVLILKSIFGLIKEVDMRDPIISKINLMGTGKKLVAFFGSLIYLTPPVPYLCGIASERFLRRLTRIQESIR